MRRALVTGATGFVGRHALAPLVARGFEVHAVSRMPSGGGVADDASGVTWHEADLLAHGEGAGVIARVMPTHLLHLAWYAEPGDYWESPLNLSWLAASLELLRAFGEHGGRRVAAAGSCAEYGRSSDPCVEGATPVEPSTLYAAAKHALHLVASRYARNAGLSLAWARLFFLYGPHERPERLVPSIARAVLAGKPAPATDGEQVRDFLYVADLGDALSTLLGGDVEGPVNVASGRAVAVREVAELTARAAGSAELLRLGELPRPADDPAAITASVTRLADEVGWRAPTALDEGIERSVAWWRARHKLGSD